jgi:hypothetical protein
MALELAKAINETGNGPYAEEKFTDIELKELSYTGLLHDFGKVYIDPQVFIKAKKLYPRDYDFLLMRLRYLRRSGEATYYEKELRSLESGALGEKERLACEADRTLSVLRSIEPTIAKLNEPQSTEIDPETEIGRILEIGLPEFLVGLEGEPIPLLTEEEILNLKIPRGSLNAQERAVIETHVEHTYAFVSKIPWPPEFKRIPEYAYKHHELLDGSGYPNKLSASDIPVQARILTICDIFDALIAADRPYKKAMPLDKALGILTDMADHGKLDKEILRIMIEKRVWDKVPPSKPADAS